MNKKGDNKSKDEIYIEEDFETSMARLADLASKGLGPDKTKDDSKNQYNDELLKEYLTPKRKAKPKTWKEKWGGKTIKLRINPYVASGIAVICLSVGFIATPRIVKYLEDRRLAYDKEQERIAMISANTDKSLKTYNVFDAAKDIGGNAELKATNLTELKKIVEEGNQAAAEKAKLESSLMATSSLSLAEEDISLDLLGSEYILENEDGFMSLLDPYNPETTWDILNFNEGIITNYSALPECSINPYNFSDEKKLFNDIILKLALWPTTRC